MTFLDGADRNEVNMAGDEYGSSYITGGGLLTIDTVSVWHAVTGFGNELVNGIAFNAGSTGAITAYAGPDGGQVTVTSSGHGLSDGDIITISGSTNYNAIYEVSNVTPPNTFEITAAWAGNDAAGTWRNGSNYVVDKSGIYLTGWQLSAHAAAANKTYSFAMSLNAAICPQGLQRRKFAIQDDEGAVAGSCMLSLTAGDIVAFNVYCETDDTNITLDEVTLTMFRIAG